MFCKRALVSIVLVSGFISMPSHANNTSVLDQATLEHLYTKHVATLSFTEIPQEPLVITFSCVPGMEKRLCLLS